MAFGLTGFISDTASTLASIVSHQVAFINNKVKQAQVQQQASNPPPPAPPTTPSTPIPFTAALGNHAFKQALNINDDERLVQVNSTFQLYQQAQGLVAKAQQNFDLAAGETGPALQIALDHLDLAKRIEARAELAYHQAMSAAQGAATASGAPFPTDGDTGQWTRVPSPPGSNSYERINADGTLNQSYMWQDHAGDASVWVYDEATEEKVTIRDSSTQTQYELYNDADGHLHGTKNGQEFNVNDFMEQTELGPRFRLPVNEVAIVIAGTPDEQTGEFSSNIRGGGMWAWTRNGEETFFFDGAPWSEPQALPR